LAIVGRLSVTQRIAENNRIEQEAECYQPRLKHLHEFSSID